MRKTKKVMVGITSTAVLFGLAGCGGGIYEQQSMSEEEFEEFTKANHAASSPAPSSSYSYSGSSSTTTYVDDFTDEVPNDPSCVEWEWDLDDGVWECEDSTSVYYGHYYHGGSYYPSKPDLYKSTNYINYKKSSSFKGSGTTINTSTGSSTVSDTSTISGGTTVKSSTGFGSGSSSFGG